MCWRGIVLVGGGRKGGLGVVGARLLRRQGCSGGGRETWREEEERWANFGNGKRELEEVGTILKSRIGNL